jgi:hypothetical protein
MKTSMIRSARSGFLPEAATAGTRKVASSIDMSSSFSTAHA